MNLSALLTLFISCLVLSFTSADCRCNCSKPSFASSFQSSSLVVKATVTGGSGKPNYDATVVTVYKGCNIGPNRKIVLLTKSSDPCGVSLSVNTTYLLMGDIERIVEVAPGGSHPNFEVIVYVSISQCQFQSRFSSLNSYQLESLKRFTKVSPCGPSACNAAKSCATESIPRVPICPGQTSTLDRLKCTYLNSTAKCGYQVLPCPVVPPAVNCTFDSCGPPLPLAPCPGGNGPYVSCDYNQDSKRCAWNITPCTFPCLSSSDCNPDSQYCSDGVCRSFGTCGNVIDCINPNNNYIVIECVGYLQCINGKCGKTCGPVCPPSAPFQETCAGCAATTCLTGTRCVDYKCGGCQSFCFL